MEGCIRVNSSGRLRVGVHRFQTYEGHPGRDGANLAYDETLKLLMQCPEIALELHDIVTLFGDYDAARCVLRRCDVVVAAVGPHAYIYFYLRERLGLSFRIIRDVRTALWNGYLLQEVLIGPYLRSYDSVIYSSAYSRDLFRKIFPNVSHNSQHVCYPLLNWFPQQAVAARRRIHNDMFTIGYVGRLTPDKNFFQVLDLLVALHRRLPGYFRVRAVGEGRPPLGYPDAARRLGPAIDYYEWYPPVSPRNIWREYATFDALFFPSTSTLETFGRVLTEALNARLPVLASSHGACSELLAPEALLQTKYYTDRLFTAHFAAPLGAIKVEEAVDRLIGGAVIYDDRGLEKYRNDGVRYISIVLYGNQSDDTPYRSGTIQQSDFVRRLNVYGLKRLSSIGEADEVIRRMRRWFLILNRRSANYPLVLLELLTRSNHRRKTLEFIGRSVRLGEDFTNIGGIDLQLSHLIRFYPQFSISPVNSHG